LDVCGPDCVSVGEVVCASTCPEFYELNFETKICEIKTLCPDRIYSPTADRGCGPNCVFEPESDKCAEKCNVFHSENVFTGVCQADPCSARVPTSSESFVCGPFPCFQQLYVCTTSCREGQIPDISGVCTVGSKLIEIVVGGNDNTVQCGSGDRPCGLLDFALHSRINIGGRINIIGSTSLGSDADITNLTIQGIDRIQTITVSKSVTLSFIGNAVGVNSTLFNLLFNISASAITKTFLLASYGGYSGVGLIVTNVVFDYRTSLNAPLILITGLTNLDFSDVIVEKVNSNLNNNALSNADDSICSSKTNNSGLLLTNVVGKLTRLTLSGISTGGMTVSGGSISLDNSTFTNNYVIRQSGFPNLRHNIYVLNFAVINVSSLIVDTGNSYFIYVAENSGCIINNIPSPLFVPVFTSAQPPALSNDTVTTFAFTGSYLYPCGLYFNFYRDDKSNIQLAPIPLNVADENTATVTLSNSLFETPGRYYGYFVYGDKLSFETPTVELLVGGNIASQSKNVTGLVVGIVIAVVAVVALVIVISVFLGWRYQIQKRWRTESASELAGGAPNEVGKVIVIYLYYCYYYNRR
jgi:hypothetical protein